MKPLVKKVAIILIVFAIALMSSCSIPGIDDSGENRAVSKEYNITFVFGDGREDEKITVKTGETVTITIPERDGYEFVGWNGNISEKNDTIEIEVEVGGSVLEACFKKVIE